MTIYAPQFRSLVINPALAAMKTAGIPVSKTAADLLMATAAVESDLGKYLHQINGPAYSVFQMQEATALGAVGGPSMSLALLRASSNEFNAIQALRAPRPIIDQLDTNLVLAAAIARLIYWQVPEPLPPDTPDGLWCYYKLYWNTAAGKTTEAEFMAALKLTDIPI